MIQGKRTPMNRNGLIKSSVLCCLVIATPTWAEIKVGIMVPTSGAEATIGTDMENGCGSFPAVGNPESRQMGPAVTSPS